MSSTVLFVDDEPKITRGMKHTLRKENYEILSAFSAQEALEILERQPVDVVVSDEQMPGLSGSDFLLLVKRNHPEVIRILLTGHASSEVALRAINEAQVYRFLLKPCNGLDMLITIRRALEHKAILAKTLQLVKACESQLLLLQKLTKDHPDLVQAAKDTLETEVVEEQAPTTPENAPDPPMPMPATAEKAIHPAPCREFSPAVAAGDSQEEQHSLKDLKPLMTRSEIQEYLDNCGELKGMSPTVAQILKITQSAQCSMDQVVKVIKQDHAISLKILKLANSSAYARGEPVDTVHKAVMRIGLTQIRQAVLNISVIEQFRSEGQEARLSTVQFWEHSIATGLIAAEIARALNEKTTELDIAFTMGLLHDIGRMVYLEILGEKYTAVLQAAEALQVPLEQVESRMLLINHADATDRILHKWKFSKELVNPIALHQLSLGNIRRMASHALMEVATLALANRLSHALLLGSSGNLTLYPTEEFFSVLKLKPDVIKMIEEKIPGQTDDIKFSMLASSNQLVWPKLRDVLAGQLHQPFRPLSMSAEPEFDALRIFCDRLGNFAEEELPNVGIIHIRRGQERAPLTERFVRAEARAGVEPLPLIILSPKGDIQLEERAMLGRQFELLPFPVVISRIIAAFNKMVLPCPTAVMV